jgi:TPR repeat protein
MNFRKLSLVAGFVLMFGCVTEAPKESKAELARKAEAGDMVAQREMGLANDSMRSRHPNFEQAARWYELAAVQGDAIAQNNLGSLYEHGLGVPKDSTKAFELYHKSADQRFAMAQNSLGRMYDLGVGVATNVVEANQWYSKAAEQGNAQAMYNLGLNYAMGRGVTHDPVQAFKWLDLARWETQLSRDLRTKYAVRGALEQAKKLMTREQIKEGERLAREWSQEFIKKQKENRAR